MPRLLNLSPRPLTTNAGIVLDGVQNYLSLGTMGNFGSNWANGFYAQFTIQTTSTAKGYWGNEATNKTSFKIGFNADQNFGTVNGKIMIHLNDAANHILVFSTASSINFNDGFKHVITITVNFSTRVGTITIDGVASSINYSNRDTLNTFTNFAGQGGAVFMGARQSSGSANSFFGCRLYNVQMGTSSSVLYGSYSLTELTGTTANDASGLGTNATLSGATVPRWIKRTAATRTPISRTPTGLVTRTNPIGVVQNNLQNYSVSDLNTIFSAMQADGVRYMRAEFIMADIQPTEGNFVYTNYDQFVDLALTYGIETVALLDQYGMPNWAKTEQVTFGHPTPQVYGTWCQNMASHYTGKIKYFEMGNEPNFHIYWPPTPSATDYMALCAGGYAGIKAGNPNAKVIAAAPGNKFATDGTGIKTSTFLQSMYDNGLKQYSDIIALHPYSDAIYDGSNATNITNLNTLLNVITTNGDGQKPVALTEIGWSTYTGGPSQAQQAANIKTFLYKIMFGEYRKIELFLMYNFRDAGTNAAASEDNFGLVKNNYTEKLSVQSFIAMRRLYDSIFTE